MKVVALPRPESRARVAREQILRELAPSVRRWVYRHVGPGPDLDDATQEALIQIAGALERFDGRSKLSTYAHRIAVRAAIRHRKKQQRQHVELELMPSAEMCDPEKLAMQRESLRRLYRALDRLSDKLRTAFILCDVEKLPHAEAAAVEDVNLETMRARLKRSRAELRRRLSADPYLAPIFAAREHEEARS